MSVDDREKKEEEEFRTGPLSVLTMSVKTNSQVPVQYQDSAAAFANGLNPGRP
jgi:small nuclear ribonucleoprotein D2